MLQITIRRPDRPAVTNVLDSDQLKLLASLSNHQEQWRQILEAVNRDGSVTIHIRTEPGTTIEVRRKLSS